MKPLNCDWIIHEEGYLGDALQKAVKGEIPIIKDHGIKVSALREGIRAAEQLKRDIQLDEWN